MNRATDILETIATRKSTGEPFALATVVCTVATTSAKAGAKAVILPDGTFRRLDRWRLCAGRGAQGGEGRTCRPQVAPCLGGWRRF